MGRPIIPIGSTRSYINDRLGRPVVSQIGPEAIEARSKARSSGRPIPILNAHPTHNGERACSLVIIRASIAPEILGLTPHENEYSGI